jgi:hypothetical protein
MPLKLHKQSDAIFFRSAAIDRSGRRRATAGAIRHVPVPRRNVNPQSTFANATKTWIMLRKEGNALELNGLLALTC